MLKIVEEPRGATYEALIRFALSLRGTFSLVTRGKPMGANAEHDQVLGLLHPFLIEETKVKTWPGNKIGRGTAVLRSYRAEQAAHTVLVEAVGGLFDWVQARRPEDLAFYDTKGRCWLETTTHEGDAFIHDELVVDVSRLQKAVPQLTLRPYPPRKGH
jgi:hypothetical protein